jgi:hypothetical protein
MRFVFLVRKWLFVRVCLESEEALQGIGFLAGIVPEVSFPKLALLISKQELFTDISRFFVCVWLREFYGLQGTKTTYAPVFQAPVPVISNMAISSSILVVLRLPNL